MPAAAAPDFLVDYARRCEPLLQRFLETRGREFALLPVDLRDAHALLADYVLRGGKRLRGALVVLGHRAGGGAGDGALDASLGVELLHAYLLIHDDFMDRDDVRRGGPTLHRSLGNDHLGASLAILLGSLCQAWAYELVLGSGLAPGEREAAKLLALALEQVTLGQLADLRASALPALDEESTLALQQLKTGSYTFELPLRLGATLAGAPAQVQDILSAYALPLGQAFQLADDLLGTFGAPEVTGKSNGGDLREGKRTWLLARALSLAAPADAAQLRAQVGRPDADVDALREILRRCGAEAAARDKAEQLCAQALRALDTTALPAGVAQSLREVALYSVRRAL